MLSSRWRTPTTVKHDVQETNVQSSVQSVYTQDGDRRLERCDFPLSSTAFFSTITVVVMDGRKRESVATAGRLIAKNRAGRRPK